MMEKDGCCRQWWNGEYWRGEGDGDDSGGGINNDVDIEKDKVQMEHRLS